MSSFRHLAIYAMLLVVGVALYVLMAEGLDEPQEVAV
jgi:hypothetical protein